jgi:hypothetical protein
MIGVTVAIVALHVVLWALLLGCKRGS